MTTEWIDSIDDPRVSAYRNLKDRTLRGESIFVTEGRLLTRRLLQSSYEAESVFVSERFAAEFRRLVKDDVPLYAAPERLLTEVVGFEFHLGVLGAGRRRASHSLDQLLCRKRLEDELSLVICPAVTKVENLGLIFRSASGLGGDGILLGRQCCDPFPRRSLRLSMGAVLWVPFARSGDLAADLRALKDRWQVELVATVLDDRAERLADFRWPPRTGLLFGNEYDGLQEHWLSACDRRVTIPMAPTADSLNLGVAAGIFMYDMMKRKRCSGQLRESISFG